MLIGSFRLCCWVRSKYAFEKNEFDNNSKFAYFLIHNDPLFMIDSIWNFFYMFCWNNYCVNEAECVLQLLNKKMYIQDYANSSKTTSKYTTSYHNKFLQWFLKKTVLISRIDTKFIYD